jgi:hypothetical protein
MAAESGSKWWPFGQSSATGSAPTATTPGAETLPSVATDQSTTVAQYPPAPEAETDQHWMISSPFAKVSWPRLQMPKLHMPPSPFPAKSELDAAKNSWVEKSPDPAKPSPLEAVKDGARRVGQSTRDAWGKTVDVFTPGESRNTRDRSSRVARREPSAWKRMFGVGDQRKVEGPQTVTEWMAQDRIDP